MVPIVFRVILFDSYHKIVPSDVDDGSTRQRIKLQFLYIGYAFRSRATFILSIYIDCFTQRHSSLFFLIPSLAPFISFSLPQYYFVFFTSNLIKFHHPFSKTWNYRSLHESKSISFLPVFNTFFFFLRWERREPIRGKGHGQRHPDALPCLVG